MRISNLHSSLPLHAILFVFCRIPLDAGWGIFNSRSANDVGACKCADMLLEKMGLCGRNPQSDKSGSNGTKRYIYNIVGRGMSTNASYVDYGGYTDMCGELVWDALKIPTFF